MGYWSWGCKESDTTCFIGEETESREVGDWILGAQISGWM